MRKPSLRFVCVVAFITLVFSFNFAFAQTKKESDPQTRQKTFEKIWKTVNEKFYDPTFGGLDWKKVHDEYAPRAARVKSDDELYDLIDEMVSKLNVSHFEIIKPEVLEKLKQPPVMVGMALKEVEGQVVIFRIWQNSSVSESPLRTGFVIKKVDDAPVEKVEDALRKFAGKANTKLRVAYLDEKDELKEITLERRLMPSDELEKESFGSAALYGILESKRLSDNIGYIHFTTFLEGLGKKIQAMIESMKDAPGIIIDLRGNGGGDDSVGLAMADMLFDKKTQLMITRTRKGDDLYYKANPKKNAYLGRVVILLDKESGSASEQFAAGMQEAGRAVVIGKTTAGEDLDADVIELPTGALLVYPYGLPRTPKGVVIEGRGVIPNIEVDLKRADLLAGKDTQLEAAIEYIKKQKR